MKNLKSLLFTALFVIISLSNAKAKNTELFSKDYKVKSFSSINANTVADIVYIQSAKVSVRVEGVQEMLDNLKIDCNKGVLTIENDRVLINKTNEALVIHISSPSIHSIETKGTGNISLNGKVKSDNLNINVEGIGKLRALDIECKKIYVQYSGIGDLKLAGHTDIVEINANGIGNIDCKDLLAKTTMVKSTKTGKVNCFASENIGLFNDGIGEITYHGNPTLKNLQNGGLGLISEAK